ncbi:MAG: hypothetical protein VW338_07275 [Rhodospirillaceae bacterium]
MTSTIDRRTVIAAGLALGLSALTAGCETQVEIQRLPDITFAHLPPFRLDVAQIAVESRFTAPVAAPHIETRLPTSPGKALRQWTKDRLKAVGGTGALKLIIQDASATRTELPRDDSLKGKFTKQQAERYDMAVKASLVLSDGSGAERATALAQASRSISVREDVSLNDRERIQFDLVDRLLADFNTEMETSIRQHLAAWLR